MAKADLIYLVKQIILSPLQPRQKRPLLVSMGMFLCLYSQDSLMSPFQFTISKSETLLYR